VLRADILYTELEHHGTVPN